MVSVDTETAIEQRHGDSLESEVDSEAVAEEKTKEIETGAETNEDNWDPLQSESRVKGDPLEDIEEEENFGNSTGRLEDRVEAVPNGTQRASEHRLDLKLTSPPPWELIDPPSDDGQKEMSGCYSARHHRALIPKSTYYRGPPTADSVFGTAPVGQLGIHHPREVLRIERDYSVGDVIQFSAVYPLELEGRLTPTQFLESINMMNEILISAHSLGHSVMDNTLAVITLQLSRLVLTTHYDKELRRLGRIIDDLNVGLYNPVGLHILWPGSVGFLFLEIEYY